MKLIIYGEPRTKKTSNKLIFLGRAKDITGWMQGLLAKYRDPKGLLRAMLSRIKVVPSDNYTKWLKESTFEFPQMVDWRFPMEAVPYNCKIIVYRSRRIGDLVGYMQAVADWLQDKEISPDVKGLHVLPDDKWIQGWDGSRLEVDKAVPRVEVELTKMDYTIDLMQHLVESLEEGDE